MLGIASWRAVGSGLALWIAAQDARAQDVLVVEQGGAFSSIQHALDLASDGDVVLIKPGEYIGFYVENKSVDVVVDGQGSAMITGSVRIVDLEAGKRVTFDGLFVQGHAGNKNFLGYGLNIQENAGSIRIQDCSFLGANNIDSTGASFCDWWGEGNGWAGAQILNCTEVAFSNCTMMGGRGHNAPGDWIGKPCPFNMTGGAGGEGLIAVNSRIAFYDTSMLGGQGGFGGFGGRGGDGFASFSGPTFSTFMSGSSAAGGNGGNKANPIDFPAGAGGPGGHGMINGGAPLSILASNFGAGAGGGGFQPFGPPGSAFTGPSPTILLGTPRSLGMNMPVRESSTAGVTFEGKQHDFVFLGVGVNATHVPFAPFSGVLLSDSLHIVLLGTTGTFQAKTFQVPIGPLAPGQLALRLLLQGAAVSAQGQIVLTEARSQVILDQSF